MENIHPHVNQILQHNQSFLHYDCDQCQALQFQIPSVFNNKIPITQNPTNQQSPFYVRKDKKKQKLLHETIPDSLQKKVQNSKHNYYSIIKMLFPQVQTIAPFSVNIMDTIFYSSDNVPSYIYTDAERGLTKIKNKNNFYDLFIKRKNQINDDNSNNRTSYSSSYGSVILNRQNSYEATKSSRLGYSKFLNYVALLKYKNDSFVRLKENQFKSLFVRPMQANQKFKHIGNIQYLQIIPNQVNYEEGTIINVDFDLLKYQKTQFFLRVQQMHYREKSIVKKDPYDRKVSQRLRQKLMQQNEIGYLQLIIFQLFAYINIHYHKKIQHGCFEFMKLKNRTYYLSNIKKLKVDENQDYKQDYIRLNILSYNNDIRQSLQSEQNDEVVNTVLCKTLQNFLENQNTTIKTTFQTIFHNKFNETKNQPDLKQSKNIFKSINPLSSVDFHELLANRVNYNAFMRKKQDQMDGFSALTSISNISRKGKAKKKDNEEKTHKQTYSLQAKSTKNKFYHLVNMQRKSSPKWTKTSVKCLYKTRNLVKKSMKFD